MARVLVTDDEKPIRGLLRLVLQQAGHEVQEAADGAEALRACRRESFDLIFCDLLMPGKEGLETIREVRKTFPGLKVVAMSGGLRAAVDVLKVARLMGAHAVLAKPFTRQEVLAKLDEVLSSVAAAAS